MTRRTRLALGLFLPLALASGCSESTLPAPVYPDEPGGGRGQGQPDVDKDAILNSVIRLVRDAATNPGGKNFDIATENLNAYFRDFKPEEFALSDAQLAFLTSQLTPEAIKTIGASEFVQRDGRHLEDNLLYRDVANRVAGEGDDLTRVRRLFDYTVRHAMLVPPGSLAPPGLNQAEARPYDVLIRGMATEDGNGWSERGWLFMVLCRQIGLDCGLVLYTPRAINPGPMPSSKTLGPLAERRAMAIASPSRDPKAWAVAVLVGGKPYMFDPALGLPIPSADGRGVATLQEAASDPRVLSQLDLPDREYEPSHRDLSGATYRVALESSLGTLSPKMKLLQARLTGENSVGLYRDPVEQVDAFKAAIGERCAGVGLWRLPIQVEHRLFYPGPGNFIQATQYPLQFFDARWPLLGARLMQLRGETAQAIQSYVVFRFAESATTVDGTERISPQVQGFLDLFATYFLALAQMEKGDQTQAKFLLAKTLEMLPEPDPRGVYLAMFRWGAMTNLGLLNAEGGDRALAIRYLSEDVQTLQTQGNLVRARRLIFQSPFVPPKETPKVIPPLAAPASRGPQG